MWQNSHGRAVASNGVPMSCLQRVIPTLFIDALTNAQLRDLNKLVMNYLVIEGYMEAADNFSKEANLVPEVELESIHQRMQIRKLIEDGNLDGAIDKLNDLNLDVLP